MANARRLVGDPASVLLTCQMLAAAVAFVVNILAARALEPAGRGELALLLQVAYLASLGLLLGSDRSVVVGYAGRPAGTVARSFVRLLTAPSAVCLTAVVALVAVPVPGIGSWRVGLAVALLFAVTNAFVRAVRSVAIAAGRGRDLLGHSLVGNGLLLAAIGLLFVLDVSDATTWLLAYLVAGAVPTAVWLARWAWRDPADVGPPGGLRTARREGLALLPSALARSGVLRLDRLLLPALASTEALGVYAAVATMTELVAWPLLAFADSRLGAWRDAHDRAALRLGRVVVAAAVYCVAAAAVVTPAVGLLLVPLLGPAYGSAGGLVVPLVAAAAVFGMAQILLGMLVAARRSALASSVEVAGFLVSVVGYVVLIGRHGALGAAYGSLLGYATCLAVAGTILIGIRRAERRA